ATDEETQNLIIERFGKSVLSQSTSGNGKQIDRQALGRIVFADAQARKDLEKIVHPRVRQVCRKRVEEIALGGKSRLVAVLVPLLFEANLQGEYNQVWTVITNESVLKSRLAHREGLSDHQIEQRLAAQLSQKEKAAKANKVIDNS